MNPVLLAILSLFGCVNGLRGPSEVEPQSKDRSAAAGYSVPPPKELALDLGNQVTMKLVLIPAGKFLMGSPKSEQDKIQKSAVEAGLRGGNFDNEGPQHEVTITKSFYMGMYEVTKGEFARFVADTGHKTDAERAGNGVGFNGKGFGLLPGYSWLKTGFEQSDAHPVVNVSWNDANAFCRWLSKKTGESVHLPTEAQWEYACRAGTQTVFPWGDNPDDSRGWCNGLDQSFEKRFPGLHKGRAFQWDDGYVFSAPVGKFKANAFGLYDMVGNVWELCSDYEKPYTDAPAVDPHGPASGSRHSVRGGGWYYPFQLCRSAVRSGARPNGVSDQIGFRVVVDLPRLPWPKQRANDRSR